MSRAARAEPGAVDRLGRIAVVLVRPKEPGNIGAAARGLRTMGLTRLVLVSPPPLDHPDARRMAHGAQDLLAGAAVFATLEEALVGTTLAIATTHRRRAGWPRPLPPAEAAARLVQGAGAGGTPAAGKRPPGVALVFGREDRGLTAAELDLCGALSRIPAATRHPSLNLAQAVMIYAWEIATAAASLEGGSAGLPGRPAVPRAPFEEVDSLLAEISAALSERELTAAARTALLRSLARFLTRAGADHRETSALRRLVRILAKLS